MADHALTDSVGACDFNQNMNPGEINQTHENVLRHNTQTQFT